jgi:hypothetical protein
LLFIERNGHPSQNAAPEIETHAVECRIIEPLAVATADLLADLLAHHFASMLVLVRYFLFVAG